jgi:hypothetical protein
MYLSEIALPFFGAIEFSFHARGKGIWGAVRQNGKEVCISKELRHTKRRSAWNLAQKCANGIIFDQSPKT